MGGKRVEIICFLLKSSYQTTMLFLVKQSDSMKHRGTNKQVIGMEERKDVHSFYNTCTIGKIRLFDKVEDDQERTMMMWRKKESVDNDHDHVEKKRAGEKCAESLCHCHSPVLAVAKCGFY